VIDALSMRRRGPSCARQIRRFLPARCRHFGTAEALVSAAASRLHQSRVRSASRGSAPYDESDRSRCAGARLGFARCAGKFRITEINMGMTLRNENSGGIGGK
jgi:hypothetical protein